MFCKFWANRHISNYEKFIQPSALSSDLLNTQKLTCSLMSSHKHVGSHHAAHPQDADHDAHEMHGLVPDQQEEPGEQYHDRDHKTIQELSGGGREQQKDQRRAVENNSSVERLLPLRFVQVQNWCNLNRLVNKLEWTLLEHPQALRKWEEGKWMRRVGKMLLPYYVGAAWLLVFLSTWLTLGTPHT